MKRIHLLYTLVLFVFTFSDLSAGQFRYDLNWDHDGSHILNYYPHAGGMYFEDAHIDAESGLPLFSANLPLDYEYSKYHPELQDMVFEPLSQAELSMMPFGFEAGNEIDIRIEGVSYFRKKPQIEVSFLPFRTNPETGKMEKLLSFHLVVKGEGSPQLKSSVSYAQQSVLASGEWYKFRTADEGVCKITWQELVNAGMNLQNIHPSQIKIFGNGNRMLPERTDTPRIDDLREVAISVHTSNPGVFGSGDYVLFYAASPHEWFPDFNPLNQKSEHRWNLYTDYSFYFLAISDEPGKRIQQVEPPNQPGSHRVVTFNDYAVYKPDKVNLAKVGREWYGERMAGNAPTSFAPDFHFPHIDTSQRVLVRTNFAVKSNEISRIRLDVNGEQFIGHWVTAIPIGHLSLYARKNSIETETFVNQDVIRVGVNYLTSNVSASAWLDYIEINARRHMIYPGGQMHFRDLATVGSNYTGQFVLENPPEDLVIWEITHDHEPTEVLFHMVNDKAEFTLATPFLREFVAFTHNDLHRVEMLASIPNQNLHGLDAHDFIIITPSILLAEAEQFAELRRNTSDLSVLVVEVEKIYNEFSSGSVDPTAIRDFIKMLYDRAEPDNTPRYLLLFGDGSYDPKDRLPDNNNLIPAFQSVESLRLDLTFVADDYYGLLDYGEGENAAGTLDLGIGRFPVNTPEEAQAMISKIEYYLQNNGSNRGNWQNTVCYVAHDEDKDLHFNQAEEITQYVDSTHKIFNIEKIYLDAYKRSYVPGGYRYPDANKAIHDVIDKGTMLVNYIGHGGETGWATSKVLTNSDILSWRNLDNMPLFLTATCSFGRFDNPELISAGELVVKNPNGGGIALFTTSRLAYSSFNFRLNKSFTRLMFSRLDDGSYYSLGELVMLAKNDNNNNMYIRNFVLLGDPSMHLLYPEHIVKTDSLINTRSNEVVSEFHGLSEITVSGRITGHNGELISDYNGIIYPVVYDKPEQMITLANHPDSSPKPFLLQNSVLFNGKATVKDGLFTFTFIVPRDVNPAMGQGKISYFAADGFVEAHGYYDDFLIGGIDNGAAQDHIGPEINMFLNDESFVSGDAVDENPVLFANISDPGGINSFGLGIGHDIVAFLNEDTQHPIILNDYFQLRLDSHTEGSIEYPFSKLPEGRHTLRLKAWDLHNNSAEAIIEFEVTASLEITAGNLQNYPNPFTSGTYFRFNHNYVNQEVDVEINIYSIQGQHVAGLGPRKVLTYGSATEPIYWDGTNNNGRPVNPGMYIYKLRMQTSSGHLEFMQGKLMKLH